MHQTSTLADETLTDIDTFYNGFGAITPTPAAHRGFSVGKVRGHLFRRCCGAFRG